MILLTRACGIGLAMYQCSQQMTLPLPESALTMSARTIAAMLHPQQGGIFTSDSQEHTLLLPLTKAYFPAATHSSIPSCDSYEPLTRAYPPAATHKSILSCCHSFKHTLLRFIRATHKSIPSFPVATFFYSVGHISCSVDKGATRHHHSTSVNSTAHIYANSSTVSHRTVLLDVQQSPHL
jgi:hypothetical protein